MTQKSSHCCPVPHPSPMIPSLAAPTPGVTMNRLERKGRPSGVEGHGVIGEAERQGLEHRDVDQPAGLGPRRLAARVPIAAKSPASHSPTWPPTKTGARSGSPRASPMTPPDHACRVNSVAALSLQGPSSPKGVMDVTIRCGWAPRISSGASAACSASRRARDQTTTSADASSS